MYELMNIVNELIYLLIKASRMQLPLVHFVWCAQECETIPIFHVVMFMYTATSVSQAGNNTTTNELHVCHK